MTKGRFIATKEHRRFVEFADTVKANGTIGICFGPAGIGKTLSARRYANWDKAEPLLIEWGPRVESDAEVYAALHRSRTVIYTPPVIQTPKQFRQELDHIISRVAICISQHGPQEKYRHGAPRHATLISLVIIDEAERLSPTSLELLRDQFDREKLGVILIGMPGLEKQFSRYPQFYSRVGFAHQYRPLTQDELIFVLQRQWRARCRELDPEDYTDHQTISAIAQTTRGNFRLLERMLIQIERIMKINELSTVTNDVVEAARSTLVIGVN
jgi:DNA transposition AAA+ family ATPase